jgi:hypothetical protein
MPLVDFNIRTLGDLVVREFSPADGYCREEVTLATGTYPMGTLVVGTALTATFAKYVAGAAVPAGSVLGIVIGDHYDIRPTFTLASAGLGLVIYRGPAQVSDFLLKSVNGISTAQMSIVTAQLNAQGVDVLVAV